MKQLLILLITAFTLTAQTILPISMEIMRELQYQYRNGEIDEYIRLVTAGQKLAEEDYDEISLEIEYFFDSDQFLETGAQYLSHLFNERELDDILTVMRDSSLKSDENFRGAHKLNAMMNKLKPYIVKYLKHKTR